MQNFKNKYFEEGFVHLPDFFAKEDISAIKNDAKAIFMKQLVRLELTSPGVDDIGFEKALYAMFEKDLTAFINCGKQIQHLVSLHQLSLDNKLIDILKQLGINEPVISTRPVLFFNSRFLAKKEVYWKTPAHQDWRSIQGSVNAVVIWIPLLDIDVKLGAVEVIPKSHLEGLVTKDTVDNFGVITDKYNQDELFVPLEVRTGDVVVFSQFLIHRSGNNVTDSIRWSCHFRFNDLDEDTFIERAYPHTYIYRPDDTLLHPNFDTQKSVIKYFSKK